MIDYRLLGPIEAAIDGRVIDLGGQRQRALLAILLLSANEPVARDLLVDRLWGDGPPAGAQHTLDVYVSRLRKALEPAAGGQVVLTRPGAYVLQAEPERIDARRFERLAAEGRRALAAGEPHAAATALRAALALWRGAPFTDVRQDQFAQPEAARLEELRATATEDRMEAELALGRHADVLGELATLVKASPLRERLATLLMIALYRSGRQPDALAVYHSARGVLVAEFGIEPGPELRRVERAILEQASWLDPPAAASADRQPAAAAWPAWPASGPRRRLVLAAAAAGLAVAVTIAVVVGPAGGGRRSAALAGPNTVGVIDAGTRALGAVVAGVGRPGGVADGAGSAWITDTSDDMLLRANVGGRVLDRIPVGPGPAGVVVGGGEVWVANQLDGTVSEVNPASGTVVATIRVGNGSAAIAAAFGSVWVANVTDGTISRIDAASGQVSATIPLGSAPAGLASGSRGIWAATSAGRLVRIDPRAGRISASFAAGSDPAGVAAGGGSVWVAGSGGTVRRLDPRTGRGTLIRLGGALAGIAYGNGALWIAKSSAGVVVRLDPRTGSRTAVRTGDDPGAVAAAGRDVLTTVLPSQAAHRGGTLTVLAHLDRADESTDPAIAFTRTQWQLLSITNDGLVTYRRTGGTAGNSLVPDLATALPAPADDGRTYVFHVRRGIRYSTGALVRPEDFRRGIERVFIVNKGGGPAFYYLGIVGARRCERAPGRCDLTKGIVADDRAGTVTFHLVAPDPEFLYKLAFPFADAIAPGTPGHPIAATSLPATGPYLTSAYVPQRRWVLVRNPRFRQWSSQAQPRGYPDRIVMRLDQPPGQAVTATEHGRADVLLSPSVRIRELATRYPSLLHIGPVSATIGLVLNTRVYPFTVRAARQAVNYAIDRSRLAAMIGDPLTTQPTCQILPPDLPGYQPYCPYTLDPGPGGVWTAPDLARAERLVAASGTRGAKVTIVAGPFGTAIPLRATGSYLVSLLDRLGYRASLRVISDGSAYNGAVFDSRRRTQVSWFSWYTDYPAPSNMIGPTLTCRSFVPARPAVNLNSAEFCDPVIDTQVSQALNLQSRAPNAAEALWARIDREIVDDAPWVPVYDPRSLVVISPRVGNFQFDPRLSLLIDQLWVR
ncbi:MAG TPA: BTAD domain-containing putative transcriptional regulator [Streptosporangiaceae bacterium]|nr:BTAD domain-containing putative transcriptional regulator [Streptosporangiaceae bacterium]